MIVNISQDQILLGLLPTKKEDIPRLFARDAKQLKLENLKKCCKSLHGIFVLHLYCQEKSMNTLKNKGIKALDSQTRGTGFKTTGWLKGQLSLSSFLGRSIEYQKLLGTEWKK